jgi:hypothetical protein
MSQTDARNGELPLTGSLGPWAVPRRVRSVLRPT